MHSIFNKKLGHLAVVVSAFLLVSIVAVGQGAHAEMSDTAKGGIGGVLIGALAGSLGGYAGAGALIGGGVGLAGGAMSDSAKDNRQKKEDQAVEDAYQKGLRDGGRVNYKEGTDKDHIDKFGSDLKD